MAFNIKWLFETLFYIKNGYIYNVPTFEKFGFSRNSFLTN